VWRSGTPESLRVAAMEVARTRSERATVSVRQFCRILLATADRRGSLGKTLRLLTGGRRAWSGLG
jgi:hypothetical protein